MPKYEIDLPIQAIKSALNKALDSSKRAAKGTNPPFQALHEQEAAAYTTAISTLKEIK